MAEPTVTQNIQHRCPRMSEHGYPHNLPVPCGDCSSLRVTAERIPWEPSTNWAPLKRPGVGGGE